MAYLQSVIKRIPLAVVAPLNFGYDNPAKTERFSQARDKGEDRYDIIKSRPFYVLCTYWDWLAIGRWNIVCLLCCFLMTLFLRRQWSLALLLLSPHLYALFTHVLTHLEPRFVMPSIFCLFFGAAYLFSKEWKRPNAVLPA